MNDNDNIILKCKDVSKVYMQGQNSIRALDDIHLEVERGKFVMICGKSGSGKSTLLNILSGFDEPNSGRIYIDGVDIGLLNEKEKAKLRNEKIGFVFQSFNLLPILTAAENILSPLLIGKREIEMGYCQKITEKLGITDRLNHLPSELSGGESQRVAVARAIVGRPAILFADEPTGNLDSESTRELIDILKIANNDFKQTIMMVTHDESLLPLADEVWRIADGKISEVFL